MPLSDPTSPAAGADSPADSKSARTRARILDAAARVLSAKGYAGMRLVDVATEAELQAPAIYYYFGSREALVEEVMWVGIADMTRHVGEVLDRLPERTSPIERILVAVEAHLRHELQISHYTTASIRNAGQIPSSIRARQVAEEERYGELWRGLVTEAHRQGYLRPELDPFIARMLVLGALNWAAEWWDPGRGAIDAIVQNAQVFVRNGLAAGRRRKPSG